MREKDRLNPVKLEQAVESSKMRKTLSIGLKTIQGGGGGIGASVLIVTILALVGITAAFLVEILAAVAGAVLFSAFALGMSYYKLWKDEQKLKGVKEGFDKKMVELKRAILESLKNYQLLKEQEDLFNEEVKRLNILIKAVKDKEEQENIAEKIKELNHELIHIGDAKRELTDRLKVMLTVMDGKDSQERIQQLFGKGGVDAILATAASDEHFDGNEYTKIKLGLLAINTKLNEPVSKPDKALQYKEQLANLIKVKKESNPTSIKWLTTALAGLGGFLGGAGSVITISALALGGMAAVTGVGWPIAVAALGVGLIAAGIGVYYQRKVENRQQKVLKKMNLATSQVDGMTHYVSNEINKLTMTKVVNLTKKHQEQRRDVEVCLGAYKKTFESYKAQTVQHTQRIRSYINEVKKFHTFKHSELAAVKELRGKVEVDIILLTSLLEQVHRVTVLAGSELNKTLLIHQIESVLNEAKQDHEDVIDIHEKIDKALHPVKASAPLAKEPGPTSGIKVEQEVKEDEQAAEVQPINKSTE